MNLVLTVSPCANGETLEYRLYAGKVQLGSSVFLTGAGREGEALKLILKSL